MEAGVSEYVSPVAGEKPEYPDSDPRDFIELNYDIYKPSTTYSTLSKAIQKDMVLANLTARDIQFIKMEFSLIETLVTIMRRNPAKYIALKNQIDDELKIIIDMVTLSRGEDGFTAKLMRKTIQEQRQTVSYGTGREKQKGGAVEGGKRFMGF